MCRAVSCKKCHKPTWAGCGAHIEQVLGHVPASERCGCREASAARATSEGPRPGIGGAIRRLFGG
jgi:hypothetical protein